MTETVIFSQIWKHSNKRSYLTGMHLREFANTPLFFNCFAHVLAKSQSRYPKFKYYAGNIRLLTPAEHSLFDQGTEKARAKYKREIEKKTNGRATADWDKLYELRDALIELYNEKFPTTVQGILNYKYTPEDIMAVLIPLNKEYFDALSQSR